MKVYVIGDYGLDMYHVGRVRGISAEVPIPVVSITETHTLPAMAGNVVANLYSLGAEPVPLQPQKMARPDATAPVKNRLVTEAGVQLARWDETDSCPAYALGELVELRHADAIVVADYGKGAITQELVEALQEFEGPIFVDTKQSPAPWIGCKNAILFPNQVEYTQFKEHYNWCEKVVLKQGADGIAYLEYGKVVLSRPSYAFNATCVNGAGDTVIAAFALATLSNFPLPQCLEFASAAAANVVEQPFLERTTNTEDTLDRLKMVEEAEVEEDATEEPEPPPEVADAQPVPLPQQDTTVDTSIANFLRHWRLGNEAVN